MSGVGERRERAALGLDLSLTSTGACVLTDDANVLVRMAIVAPGHCGKGFDRLYYIHNRLKLLLVEFTPDVIMIEGYSYGSARGLEAGAEVRGAVAIALAECCYELGRNVFLVPPTSLKKYVLGKGAGDKDMMRLGVYKRWGFEAPTNDEVDAYALARIGLAHLMGDAAVLTVPQQEVLDKVFGGGEEGKGEKKKREPKAKKESKAQKC